MNYCLAGNPNCGKTTLYNALTGSNQYVGNWPGVTVEKREAYCPLGGGRLTDLPGLYSLSPYSIEERVSRDYLLGGDAGVVINVVDATSMERGLYLTLQLIERGLKVVVALNMMDEMEKRGAKVDASRLSKALGVGVAPISARRREGLKELMDMAAAADVPKKAAPAFGGSFAEAAKARYDYIEMLLIRAGVPRLAYRHTLSDAIDRVLLSRFFAYPALMLAMGLMFFLTFGAPGEALRTLMEGVMALTETGARALLDFARAPEWVLSMAAGGVIAGVGSVLSFLPQILTLFFCLSILEDSGYMARSAFMTDRPLRLLGLSGRSFIPMLMGFGCTTTAVMAARGVENQRDRRMTILLTPFVSCGAKLPIYALFAAAFFPGYSAPLVTGLYALGLVCMVAFGAVLRRAAFRDGVSPFVMEFPEYRLPTLRGVFRRLSDRARDFMARAGTIVFAMSVVIWFLRYFSPAFSVAAGLSESILGKLGAAIAPAFTPLGFGAAAPCVALIAGLAAKEAVVSALLVAYGARGIAGAFTPASAMAFLVFVLLYTPCVSALSTMRRELGAKWTGISALGQLAFAYAAAFFAYRTGLILL